jgi:hypothetical protein
MPVLSSRSAHSQVLVVGIQENTEEVLRLAEAGAIGFLPRDASLDELVRCVYRAIIGDLSCSPRTIAALARRVTKLAESTQREASPPLSVATREFAKRHGGRVWLCYFNENQKGSAKWDHQQHIVQVNRTEALDAAKRGIRDAEVVLPRRGPLLETFAEHLASDAKKLIEDEETGAKSYRYIRTGTNHYSLAFTYDWLASEQERRSCGADCFRVIDDDDDSMRPIMYPLIRMHRNEGFDWPPRWDPDRIY